MSRWMLGLSVVVAVCIDAGLAEDDVPPLTCPLCGGGPDAHALALGRLIETQVSGALAVVTSHLR